MTPAFSMKISGIAIFIFSNMRNRSVFSNKVSTLCKMRLSVNMAVYKK